MYDEELPVTGASTFVIGGLVFHSWTIALVALGMVLFGCVLLRVFRRRRTVGQ
jgi:hypothetical protein